jgi:hypothetical protein
MVSLLAVPAFIQMDRKSSGLQHELPADDKLPLHITANVCTFTMTAVKIQSKMNILAIP